MRMEEKLLVERFPHWLQCQVPSMKNNNCDEELIVIALGPSTYVRKYNGFIINAFRFRTKSREMAYENSKLRSSCRR